MSSEHDAMLLWHTLDFMLINLLGVNIVNVLNLVEVAHNSRMYRFQ